MSAGNHAASPDVPVGTCTSRSLDQGQQRTGHQVTSPACLQARLLPLWLWPCTRDYRLLACSHAATLAVTLH